MGDVGADVSVAARDDLRQLAVIVGDDERESVELPGNPDRTPLRPLRDFAHLLRLRERKCRVLVGFLLADCCIGGDAVRGAVGQHHARLGLECFHLVEEGVPLEVSHQFGAAVVVGVRRLVQPRHRRAHLI